MRTVGKVTTAVAGVLAVLALALGVKSIPDLRRYLRMRAM
jgi:hypothetical protein